MAKKTTKNTKKKPNSKRPAKEKAPAQELSPEQKDARAISQLLGQQDAEGAAALTRQFFPEGSLGRVSSGFDANGNRIRENQDVLDRARAAMEAYGPGGGGRRSADVQNLIDRSRAGLDRSAEAQGNLDRTKAGLGRTADDANVLAKMEAATNRSGENQALIDQANSRVGRTQETRDFIGRMNSATAGYSSPENQAMLEQQMRGINQGFQQGQQRIANNAGKMGIRGGTLAALAAKNQRAAGRAEAETRQDLFVRNADEKQRRLMQYGDAVSGAESAEQGRFRDAGSVSLNIQGQEASNRGAYASTARNVQDAEERRGNTYNDLVRQTELDDRQRLGDFGGYVAGAEADEYGRERDTRTDYFDTLGKVRGDELNRSQINLDKTAAERAGQNSTYFGGLEYSRSRRDAEEARRLNRDYYNLAKSQFGGGRGRQTGRGPNTGTPAEDPRLGFFDEASKVVNKY
jgi:hypothetical protein